MLVKPQFEVGRSAVGHGGKVKHEADRTEAIDRVKRDAEALGFEVLGGQDSVLCPPFVKSLRRPEIGMRGA